MTSPGRERLAFDLVLVPDAETIAVAREANARLRAAGQEREIDLDRAWPHVSLVMGLLRTDRLPALETALTALAALVPRDCPTLGLQAFPRRPPRETLWIGLEITDALRRLQEAALALPGLRTEGTVSAADFAPGPPPATPSDADFATHYPREAAGARFSPHVTLGRRTIGEGPDLSDLAPPDLLRPQALALAWLGAGCTCPELIWRRDLETG